MGSMASEKATPVDGVDVLGALSPSRAGDFMTCPLLYRFRTIDKLPEPYSPVAVRGTLIHKVLEDLFDLAPDERTPQRAADMLVPGWEALLEAEPALAEMFGEEGPDVASWLTSCREVLDRYFTLEDPRRLEPAERELYVETLLDSRLLLRGIIDRIDVAPDGAIRVVDYKGLALDTRLPTPTGWTTMAEVEAGDLLVGADGRPTRVTGKSDVHRRPCYRVTFDDGSTVVCDNVHLWTVTGSDRQRRTRVTVDADALFARHLRLLEEGRGTSLWIDAAAPLELPDAPDLPVDPWLLGAWLADGATRSGQLTVGGADLEDMLVLVKERWDRDVSVVPQGAAYSVHLGKVEDVSLSTQLRRAGLIGRKHIPPVYLRAGRAQRIDLLRGLMDTGGWWDKQLDRAVVTTEDDELADQVVELLRTLGLHPQHLVEPSIHAGVPNRDRHVIEFTPRGFNPFSLPHKAVEADAHVSDVQGDRGQRRIITRVEPIDSVPTQCVVVDAEDHLYLCGDGFVPTHNSGKSPGEMFEAKALFQMKFYALVIWRTRGVIPAMLQLIYLGNGELLRYTPDERDLLAIERKVEAVWKAIRKAEETGDWRPSPGRLCEWCAHQALCPAFGGTPPPLPVVALDPDPSGDLDTDEGLTAAP